MPESTTPSAASERASDAMRWAIWMLLLIYILPLVLLTYDYVRTSFVTPSNILLTFVGVTASADDSFAILHRVLLPLMGGFAPLAFRDDRTSASAIGIMGVLILGIFLSLFLFATFNSPAIQEVLKAHSLFAGMGSTADAAAKDAAFATGITQIKGFLNRTQEAMGMYLMLIFGLKLEKATR